MIKDYRILLLLALTGIVLVGMSLVKALDQDYTKHQKEYYELLGVEDYTVEIKQINVKTPGAIIVDRCQSCHVGASNPDAASFEQPLATHPPIVPGVEKDPHEFGKIGCAVCHDGNSRALKIHDAHGEYHGWPYPLLPGKIAQANCNRCHAMEGGELAGAEIYERGQTLFLEKACWGCHTIAGISTSSQAPELTDAGGKFTYAYLEESILEPSANIPNSKMPKFGWITNMNDVTALATYLKGQQKHKLRSDESTPLGYIKPASEVARIAKPSVEAGRALFAGVDYEGSIARGGCINCHAFRNSDGDIGGGQIGPDLTYAFRARGRQYVKDHIRNARVHVADSIMPTFKDYSEAEIDSVVDYLATFDYEYAGRDTGSELFNTFCMSCHGEKLDGRGPVSTMLDPLPRDFTKFQFVDTYKDRFKDSIKEGVKGTAMPPWENILSDEQVDLLIQYIKDSSLVDSEGFKRMEAPLPKIGDPERMDWQNKGLVLEPGDPERGNATFQKFCTSCHGKLANGKGPSAYDLVHPLPRDLLNKEFMNQPNVTDERLYQSILLGVAGTPMPAWDQFLTDQDILDIIAFIRENTKESE